MIFNILSKKLTIKNKRVSGHVPVPDLNWYKSAVGGMWEEIGKLQFKYLVSQGLKPNHYLLDVGCGSLRGGIHFIRYLKPHHYFGIDINKKLLEAGKKELKINNLMFKKPTLVQMGDFTFQSLKQKFEYMLAVSVFTHLPLNNIIRCLVNAEKVLAKNGQFYTTFFKSPNGKFSLEPIPHPRVDGPDIITYFDKDPYHYDFGIFKKICSKMNLKVKYLGDWSHPRSQKMAVFSKKYYR